MGRAGVVGVVEVDVLTGEMYLTPGDKAEFQRRAQELAEGLPAYRPRETPPAYLANQLVPTHQPGRLRRYGVRLPGREPSGRVGLQSAFAALGAQPDVGAPFSNLQRLARRKITVIYRQGTLAELYRLLANGWPCIVPVKAQVLPYWEGVDSEIAVVVVGMDAASVFVNDPAFTAAPIQVALGDFELAWLARDESLTVLAP